MVFADAAIGPCTSGVEISQRCKTKVIRFCIIGERVFNHQFGESVRIDRRFGSCFWNGNHRWFAVGSRCTAKDNFFHIGFAHAVKQFDGRDHIVAVVKRGIGDRFVDSCECGEVHDGVDLVVFQSRDDFLAVRQFAFDQHSIRNGFAVSARKIVVNGHILASI